MLAGIQISGSNPDARARGQREFPAPVREIANACAAHEGRTDPFSLLVRTDAQGSKLEHASCLGVATRGRFERDVADEDVANEVSVGFANEGQFRVRSRPRI